MNYICFRGFFIDSVIAERIQLQKGIKLAAGDIGSFVSPNGAQCDSPGPRAAPGSALG